MTQRDRDRLVVLKRFQDGHIRQVQAARELEITLTARNKEKGQAVPMCGVPYHSAENYIARLIQKGYRVAVCDQTEDPKATKGLVKREVMRIVTPGTAMNPQLLRSHENNFLAAVSRVKERAGLAYVDISTGEFRATELAPEDVQAMLENIAARELLIEFLQKGGRTEDLVHVLVEGLGVAL